MKKWEYQITRYKMEDFSQGKDAEAKAFYCDQKGQCFLHDTSGVAADMIRDTLNEEGKKAVVLMDEVQMLNSKEIMEEFRGLLNLEVPERKLLSFVFFGLPELEENLTMEQAVVSGIATGLFLGELVAPLKVVADGFVKLLQMSTAVFAAPKCQSNKWLPISNACGWSER